MLSNYVLRPAILAGALVLGAVTPALAQTDGADRGAHHTAPAAGETASEREQAPSTDDAATMRGMAGKMTPEMMQTASQAHEGHGSGAGSPADESAWAKAFREANQRMHAEMDIEFSDSADVDFVRGMIAHHEGAIDMARVVLDHGEDPQLRQLAQEMIDVQQDEVDFMESWLADRQQ